MDSRRERYSAMNNIAYCSCGELVSLINKNLLLVLYTSI